LRGRLAILFWTLLTFLTLLPTEIGILDTPHNFAPHFRILAAYAVFFLFGWGLYCHRNALDALRRVPAGIFTLVLPFVLLTAAAIDRQMALRPARDWPAFTATATLTALTAWLMIFGLLGLFLRRCGNPSPRARYLADSAYWLYLFHPPVLVALQMPMLGLPWPAEVKFLVGLTLSLPVLFLSYDRCVRPTWLGVILNGRRFPRGLPAGETAPVPHARAPLPAEA
jgi:peptidoglycan/LPS O-acetylase OafA/YrhL